MKYLFQIVLIIPIVVFGQMSNDEIESEISSLNDSKQLQEYWISLHKKDQSVRGKFSETQTKVDRENLKKMVTLIKYHGYPSGFCYGCVAPTTGNFTPNIIVTHSTVRLVNEFVFPILKEAYNEGKANEFWYIHNLMGMVRSRYGRDFYEKKVENISKFYEKLEPFVAKKVQYDLVVIDSLYKVHDKELNEILTSTLIFSKKQKGIRNNIYKLNNGKLYWQRVYTDGSFNFPQEIYFDDKKGLRYVLNNEIIDDITLIKNLDKFIVY
jgi:hypothetical protein